MSGELQVSAITVKLNNGQELKMKNVGEVEELRKAGKISNEDAKEYTAMFQAKTEEEGKGTTVQKTEEQPDDAQKRAASADAQQKAIAETAAAKKAAEEHAQAAADAKPEGEKTEEKKLTPEEQKVQDKVDTLKENGVKAGTIDITSHGNGTYTADINAPTEKQTKIRKADEKKRMAR